MPNPAAISPPVSSTIDGRIRCSVAMTSATMPNTEFLNRYGRQDPGLAQHGLQAGIAGQRHGRELDREIAQIERIADGEEADDQQPLHLIGRQPKRSFFHRANMAGESRRRTTRRRASRVIARAENQTQADCSNAGIAASVYRHPIACRRIADSVVAICGLRRLGRSSPAWRCCAGAHGWLGPGAALWRMATDHRPSWRGADRRTPWSRRGRSLSIMPAQIFAAAAASLSGPATSRNCMPSPLLLSFTTMIGRNAASAAFDLDLSSPRHSARKPPTEFAPPTSTPNSVRWTVDWPASAAGRPPSASVLPAGGSRGDHLGAGAALRRPGSGGWYPACDQFSGRGDPAEP